MGRLWAVRRRRLPAPGARRRRRRPRSAQALRLSARHDRVRRPRRADAVVAGLARAGRRRLGACSARAASTGASSRASAGRRSARAGRAGSRAGVRRAHAADARVPARAPARSAASRAVLPATGRAPLLTRLRVRRIELPDRAPQHSRMQCSPRKARIRREFPPSWRCASSIAPEQLLMPP